MRTYKEACEINAEWWAEKSFNTPMNQDNGDSNSLALGLMNSVSSKIKERTTPEQIKKFKSHLVRLMLEAESAPEYSLSRICTVDYNPNFVLRIACTLSEIDPNVLPCKTFTRIKDNNEIEGRYQYGGEWFTI